MSVPAWYQTYLLLHQVGVHPFSEPASVPFLSDVWNVDSIFVTPHSDEEPASLSTFSLLPSVWDTALGQAAPGIPRAPFIPEDSQASHLASQNPNVVPAYNSSVPQQDASATFGASSPVKNFGMAHHQQENAGTQPKEGEDVEKKTRRIASKLHIMASKKQLNPANVSDDEARALIHLQLKANVPLLPPWYRHASR